MEISVVVATYGDKDYWDGLAQRALDSIYAQSDPPDEVIRYHGTSLAQSRNHAIESATSERIICVDADDQIDEYYLACMKLAQGDIRYPRLKYVYSDGSVQWVTSSGHTVRGNHICIGAMFRKDLFLKVGGFKDEPVLEDLSLWLRMEKAGAQIRPSNSIYIAHVREKSRNKNQALKDEWAHKLLAS